MGNFKKKYIVKEHVQVNGRYERFYDFDTILMVTSNRSKALNYMKRYADERIDMYNDVVSKCTDFLTAVQVVNEETRIVIVDVELTEYRSDVFLRTIYVTEEYIY